MSPSHAAGPARRATAATPATEMRDRLLAAMAELLREHRFDAISVADVIRAAGVSKASFYFYFAGKQAVLAELVCRAVAQGHQAAQPWVAGPQEPVDALRAGVAAGARLWRDNAGVLMAIVESWGSDEELRRLWLEQMDTFTDAAVIRIKSDPVAMRRLEGADIRAIAASLTWLGERLYYLAAAGVAPFADEAVLVDTLTDAWTAALYGVRATDLTDAGQT